MILDSAPLRISVDRRTNSVVVRGTPTAVDEVERIIKELGQPVPLIELEVMIVQADAGIGRTLGVQWAGAETDRAGDKTFGLGTGTNAGAAVKSLADNALNANSTTQTIVGSGGATVTNTQLAVDAVTLMPIDDLRGTAAFKAQVAAAQVARALHRAE